MPTLKQLTCHVEWAGSNVPFKEYETTYGDGSVECYIAIPNSSTPFSVSLKSNGYIASGLAIFVFMDGVYQCNRNRDDLRAIAGPSGATKKFRDISFRVRQKEERLPDGSWIGRPWRFEPFQTTQSTPNDPEITNHFCNLGIIEVIVLRCEARHTQDESDGALTPESGMAPGSGCEDNISISSDESFAHQESAAETPQENNVFEGAFGAMLEDAHMLITPSHIQWLNSHALMQTMHIEKVLSMPRVSLIYIQLTFIQGATKRAATVVATQLCLTHNAITTETIQTRSLAVRINAGYPRTKTTLPATFLSRSRQGKVASWYLQLWNKATVDPGTADSGYYIISDGKRIPERRGRHEKRNKSPSRRKTKYNHQSESSESESCSKTGSGNNDEQDNNNNGSWDQNDNNQPQDWGGQSNGNGGDGENTGGWGNDQNANSNDNFQATQDWNNSGNGNNETGNSNWDQPNNAPANSTPFTASQNVPQPPPMQQRPSYFDLADSSNDLTFVSPMSSAPIKDEPALYTVPESVAQAESLSHQVQIGSRAKYIHRIRTPRYIDDMDEPYAKFTFKYRVADVIQNKFNTPVIIDIDDERKKLEVLPRAEIVKELLRVKSMLEAQAANPGGNLNTHSNNNNPGAPTGNNFPPQIPPQNQGTPQWGGTTNANANAIPTWNTVPQPPQHGGAHGEQSANQQNTNNGNNWDNNNSAPPQQSQDTWDSGPGSNNASAEGNASGDNGMW
ncbi:hypothetical protein FQN50_001671 [Emmonsiellopsis sp. PD_5]|nr:hypothetical protein FQN50_001671 [Emmonsiellopsis sp. PD_5]